jgi:2-polyprenyl-3-methyl-5-hydroxy-6-metoxy-1,4-benzoquinol methylase
MKGKEISNSVKFSKSEFKVGNILDYKQVLNAVANFYDYILPKYNLIFPRHREEQKKFASFLHRQIFANNNYEKICDVACGNGALLYELSKLGKYTLYGIDISQQGIRCAKNLLGNKATLLQKDWLSLNKLNNLTNYFDVVICTGNSIAHLPPSYLNEALQNFSAIIKPGGVLIIDTYSDSEWKICETNKFVPRSCRKHREGWLVVIFRDTFQQKNNLKYTIKSVDIIRFGIDGLPRQVKSFEVLQFVIKSTDLLKIIKYSGEFKKITELSFIHSKRFSCFMAQKK